MACVKCNRGILGDENHYIAADLGPELLFIIEQDMAHEIAADAALCEACFNSMSNLLESTHNSTEVIQENIIEPVGETNVCVWCLLSLTRRRTHLLTSGPQRDAISNVIAPRQIPDGAIVCHRCWTRASRLVNVTASDSGQAQHICVWCRHSLSQRRTCTIPPHGPERDEIAAGIAPRQILPGDRVCYACWVSARRNVQHATNPNTRNVCVACSTSLVRRRTYLLLDGPVRDVISRRIYPRQVSDHSLVCNGCWTWAQDAVHRENEQPVEPEPHEDEPPQVLDIPHNIELNRYKKVGMSSASCFVPGCTNTERHIVPGYLRKNMLSNYKIYIVDNARVCLIHKNTYDWDHIFNLEMLSNVFSAEEIEKMMEVNNDLQTVHLIFSNIENIDDDVFRYWTGLNRAQFLTVFNEVPQLRENCKIPRTALGLFFVKARTGDSHERLATLFRMSKMTVTRLLKKAREALMTQFVPSHLGLGHISRENIINKNLTIPEGLFGNREERKPIIIFDGTYIYIQKSSNYLYQKMTYSLHKYRNLVKPFLLVATDGYIINVCGPYPASMSDADIMKSLFENENGPYRQHFRPGDIFILDRGFRDALPLLENIYKVYKPESLQTGETQLSTINANKSRLVTLCRWVVEVVNGRFKLQFKIFRQEYFNVASSHLMDDLKISAAIINAFHSPLVDRPDAEAILNRALQRVNLPNVLGAFIVENNMNRRRANFLSIDSNHPLLEVFPQMTMSDLILFALGIYQIKQARSYFGEHIRQNGSFVVELCSETMVPGTLSSHESIFIRGRIKSRHQSNKIYYTYILISARQNHWENGIEGYYCSCICGMRTVGCCAHVMTIVWYLGWARYQNNVVAPASFLDNVLVREEEE